MIKVNHLSQYYPLFKDKTVVDIGCNAGVITERIAEYAEKVYGVEKDIKWVRETPKDNIEYVNLPIGEFLMRGCDYNAAYASCVLYYLTNAEINLIEKILFPKCDLIMFVSYEVKPDLGNNGLFLSKWQNINNWLQKNGFKTEVKDDHLKWATIIGTK